MPQFLYLCYFDTDMPQFLYRCYSNTDMPQFLYRCYCNTDMPQVLYCVILTRMCRSHLKMVQVSSLRLCHITAAGISRLRSPDCFRFYGRTPDPWHFFLAGVHICGWLDHCGANNVGPISHTVQGRAVIWNNWVCVHSSFLLAVGGSDCVGRGGGVVSHR